MNKISHVHTKNQSSITPRKKGNSKKSFQFRILRWTSFLMIPLTILHDEYIDRPKLTEQKNPFEYIVSPHPPQVGSEQLSENVLQSFQTDSKIFVKLPLNFHEDLS